MIILHKGGSPDAPTKAEIMDLLRTAREGLAPSLQEPLAASEYANKLLTAAEFAVSEAGLVAYYANDLSGRRAFVSIVAVRPELRGGGAGRSLMDAVLNDVRNRGFAAVALEVLKGNKPAIALYERLGFKRVGETETSLRLEAQL